MSGSNCADKLLSGRILLVTYLAKSHLGIPLGAQYRAGPQQLAATPATPYLLKLFNIKTEAIQGSGFSPGKGGGRHFLTHDQITPLSPLPPFTPCSPVLACFFLPMLGPSASPPRQLSFVGATPGFHHTGSLTLSRSVCQVLQGR